MPPMPLVSYIPLMSPNGEAPNGDAANGRHGMCGMHGSFGRHGIGPPPPPQGRHGMHGIGGMHGSLGRLGIGIFGIGMLMQPSENCGIAMPLISIPPMPLVSYIPLMSPNGDAPNGDAANGRHGMC